MKQDSDKDGLLRQIMTPVIVSVLSAFLVSGTSPFWLNALFPPSQLIPANMVGVWEGTLKTTDSGSTHVYYTLFGDGDIKVQDDCSYKHLPLLYHLKEKAVDQTILLKLHVEGLGVHQAEIKLSSSGKLHVTVISETGSQGVQREGDLTFLDQLPTKETETSSQCR